MGVVGVVVGSWADELEDLTKSSGASRVFMHSSSIPSAMSRHGAVQGKSESDEVPRRLTHNSASMSIPITEGIRLSSKKIFTHPYSPTCQDVVTAFRRTSSLLRSDIPTLQQAKSRRVQKEI